MFCKATIGKICAAALSAASGFASVATAEIVQAGAIDGALETGIDFRSVSFEACLDTESCRVGDLTILAERQAADGTWGPAKIYWDPIDGFGVIGGRQNDEIDADERLTIEFAVAKRLAGVWLSDLFIGEAERYLGEAVASEDVETASIALMIGNKAVSSVDVHGVFELPEDPFESTFTDVFAAGGDLLNRVIVDEGSISVMIPDGDSTVPVVLPLGQIDPAKAALFAENATASVDLNALLGQAGEIPVFESGSDNASKIIAIRDDLAKLENLRELAELQRRIGDAENGELGWYADKPQTTDRIVLTAGLQTSNDYSVAGLMIAGPFDNAVYMAELAR